MKILLVGLGSIGQRHLRNLKTVCGSGVEIEAYRSTGREIQISDDMSAAFDVDLEQAYDIKTFDNYETALDQSPDAVFITCPTSLHIPMAIQAARRGCHLFIEKPLSHNLEGIDELVKLTESNRLVTLIGYQLRFHPGLLKIRDMLQSNTIGQVIDVNIEFGEYLPDAHPFEDYRQGYAAREDLGGGALLSLIHEIDYAQWLFGLPQKLFALGGKVSSLEMDADDTVSILMECVLSDKPVPVSIHLDFIQRLPSRKCIIIAEKAKIIWDYFTDRIDFYTDETREWQTIRFDGFERNTMFVDEIAHFVRCIEENEKPSVDIREGTRSLRVALAAKRSIQSGMMVEDI